MNQMQTEYSDGTLILKILDATHCNETLDFYYRNRASFEPFETQKPHNFYTSQYQAALLESEFAEFTKGHMVRFFVSLISDPEIIVGTISFSNMKHGAFCSCNIGYKIDESYRRCGIGSNAINYALQIVCREFHMHRIEAYISPNNTASIKTALRCGFVFESNVKDYVFLNRRWNDYSRYIYISTYQ